MFSNKAAIQEPGEACSLLTEPRRLRALRGWRKPCPAAAQPFAACRSSLPRLKLQTEKYYHSGQALHTRIPCFPHEQFLLTTSQHIKSHERSHALQHALGRKNKSGGIPAQRQHYVPQNLLKTACWKPEELCDLPESYPWAFATELIQINSLGSKEKRSSISKKLMGSVLCVNSRRGKKKVF